MSDLAQFVAAVDGTCDNVTQAVTARYASVDELAGARKADLQALPGVGSLLATRLLEAARATSGTTKPAPNDDILPPRMRDAIEDAASLARPLLRVVEGSGGDLDPNEIADAEPPPPSTKAVASSPDTPAAAAASNDQHVANVDDVRRNHPASGASTATDTAGQGHGSDPADTRAGSGAAGHNDDDHDGGLSGPLGVAVRVVGTGLATSLRVYRGVAGPLTRLLRRR